MCAWLWAAAAVTSDERFAVKGSGCSGERRAAAARRNKAGSLKDVSNNWRNKILWQPAGRSHAGKKLKPFEHEGCRVPPAFL